MFEALEAWVLNLIEPVAVKDWYEGMVISYDREVWETRKEKFALGYGP